MTSDIEVILVRHGETAANRIHCFAESDEIALTDEGRGQAEEIAGRLSREFRPDIVLSSKFARARQTAEIIARALGLETAVLAGIHERNFGCLRGQPYGRMGETMRSDPYFDSGRPWEWAPGGGESLEEVRRRVMPALDTLPALYAGKQVVVVSHGAAIQAVWAHITGDSSEEHRPLNCGVVIVAHDRVGWSISRHT